MAPKRKLEEEDGDVSAGSAGEEKQEEEAGATTTEAAPVKKGRGRPKKTDKKPYAPTGKPRGRPRTKEPGSGTDSDSPKKRGRPSLASKTETDSDVEEPTPASPKKRGRPPKSATASDEVEETTPASPKKRGRPALASKVQKDTDSESGDDDDVEEESSDPPRKRGRPAGSTKNKKKGGVKAAKNNAYVCTGKPRGRPPLGENGARITPYKYIPTGKPRGRRPMGENGARITPYKYIPTGKPRGRRPMGENGARITPYKYIPTGKPRGRRPMGENGAKKTTPYIPTGKPRGRPPSKDTVKSKYVPTGKPRGRKPIGEKALQVKKKYFKKEKHRLQVKQFKVKRVKFKAKAHEKKFTVKPIVKPLKTDSLKNKTVPNAVTAQSHREQKPGPRVNARIYNVTPSRGSNVQFPMLNDFQRSLLHVNHSKNVLNYESDREPALDVLQKKLLAVNTQLIDTEEQRLELDKRIIIIKQRKIELERQLLNYQPQRRVLTRVEQIPVIDMVNDHQENGIEHGAKIQGWVSVAENRIKSQASCIPSLKNCEGKPNDRTLGPQHSRERSSAADEAKKEVKKPKKVTSRSEKRGRGRPRKH